MSRRRSLNRFVIELALVNALLATFIVLARYGVVPIPRALLDDGPWAALQVAATLFLTIAFYGTSFEVTPFSFFVRMFQPTRLIEVPAKSASVSEARSANIDVRSHEVTPEAVLADSVADAAMIARRMERRINTHLILGLFIGLVGLGVWFFSFSLETGGPISTADLVREMTPRLTILLFIELLAGFFLRQYRVGVEDFKYFLEVQRRLAARHIAYLLIRGTDDKELAKSFLTAILSQQSDIRLGPNETSTVIEAMKNEQNIALSALGTIKDQIEAIGKALKKG
jgi:hypothetical protein